MSNPEKTGAESGEKEMEQEQPEAKKIKVDTEEERRRKLKNKTFTMLLHLYKYYALLLEIDDGNLYLQERLLSHMYKAFKLFRQALNNTGNANNINKLLQVEADFNGNKFKPDDFIEKLKTLSPLYGFEVKKTEEWIGMMAYMLSYFSLFKARIEELQMGHWEMIIKTNREVDISYYGLNLSHGILLEGSRWSPHIRSAFPSACGPLTQLICYRMACRKNRNFSTIDYSAKWANVLKKTLDGLPYLQDIITLAKTCSHYEFQSFLPILGNVLFLFSSGQVKKTALPMAAHVRQLAADTINLLKTQIDTKTIADPIAELEFVEAGKKAIQLYNNMGKFSMPGVVSADVTSQILFHGVFGSYGGNLNVLKWMTRSDIDWATRSCMGKSLLEMSEKDCINAEPKKIHYYSEPASSNMSYFYKNRQQDSIILMSEKNDRDRLISLIEESVEDIGYQRVNKLKRMMQRHIEIMINTLKKNGGIISWGNTDWEDLNNDSKKIKPPGVFEERLFGE